MSYPDFSVLLSVYWKENPDCLRLALKSIWDDQTVKPSEIVLVKDGALTPELDLIISDFQQKAPIMVVALKQNQGLGCALNEGLKHCSCEWVARMDSDDIAKPGRFESQIGFMTEHPDISVCSSWIDEFIDNPGNTVFQRRLPETAVELCRFGRRRNPINHPVVMFRKSAVLAAGGYEHFPLFEDYWLWVRMIVAGCKMYNIQQSLLWFRISPDVYRRRGGWRYAMTEIRFQYRLWRLGYISILQLMTNCISRFCIRVLPNEMRRRFYGKMVRN